MKRYARWAWIVLMVLAAALRLLALNGVPLAPDEATAALASLDAARGAGWARTAESPLLLAGNGLLFLLFGGGDGLARLLPALAGVALVGAPWLWRKRLGETGALVAAGLLLCSPLALFGARRVDGASLGVLGAALLLTALLAADDEPWPAWMSPALVVAGLTLGLTGGPSFYDALFSGALAWAFSRWIVGAPLWTSPRKWARPVVWGVVGALLVSIGLGLRWNGWSGVADGLAAWLTSWRAPRAGLAPIAVLFLYEPLTLLLVVLGLAWAVKKTATLPLALALWGFMGLLLVSLRPGAMPTALAAALFPLAMLAGYGVQQTANGVPGPVGKWMALHGLIGFIFWLPVGLALAGHANGTASAAFVGTAGGINLVLLFGGVALIALQVLIALLFSLTMPLHLVWRGAFLGAALLLLVTQTGFAWGLAFVRADSPVEPAVTAATSPDVYALRAVLDEMAVRGQQRRDDFPVTVVAQDTELAAVARWTLRDFARVSVAEFWPANVSGVVMASPDVAPPVTETAGWEGMAFTAIARGPVHIPACQSFSPLACSDLARWYLFRQTRDPRSVDALVLWRMR